MGYSLVRWTIVIALLAGAFFALNRALFSIMATAAPPTNEYPDAWAYEFYLSAGHLLALLAAATFVAVNLRKGFPYLKRKWTVVLVCLIALGIIVPRANQFLSVDSCLDSGGCWDYQANVCRKDEPNAQALCDRMGPR